MECYYIRLAVAILADDDVLQVTSCKHRSIKRVTSGWIYEKSCLSGLMLLGVWTVVCPQGW